MDMEVDTPNWNLCGHTMDMLYPIGLCGGTYITVVAGDNMELGANGL